MLKLKTVKYYKVKEGQSLREIAAAFSVAERKLVLCNGLTEEPHAGRILRIPDEKGNAYTVQAGDTKTLLCGSDERFRLLNGTDVFYIGMRVII